VSSATLSRQARGTSTWNRSRTHERGERRSLPEPEFNLGLDRPRTRVGMHRCMKQRKR
jgi:hypothetical protein